MNMEMEEATGERNFLVCLAISYSYDYGIEIWKIFPCTLYSASRLKYIRK